MASTFSTRALEEPLERTAPREPASDPVILRFPGAGSVESAPSAVSNQKRPAAGSATVAIVLPGWIGDVVMATPALRAFREHFGPEARLIGLAKPYVTAVLDGTPWLDEILPYAPRSADPEQHMRQVAGVLRRQQLHTIVVMNRSLRSCLLAHLSRARKRVGYGRALHRLLLWGQSAQLTAGSAHSPLDRYLALATALSGREHSRQLELATLPADERAADLVWNRFRLWQSPYVVALNGGSAAGNAKHWPLESFTGLARRLATQHDCSVLVMCGPGERESAAAIAAAANHPRVFSMAEQDLSLGTAKACLRRADLLVSTDSGPRHIAAAFDVPSVSLLGPMADHLSRNYHQRDLVLRASVECAPCGKHICPLGENVCMQELTVDRVLAASLRQLAKLPAKRLAA